jgi:hypothetical protein
MDLMAGSSTKKSLPSDSRFKPALGKAIYALLLGGPILNLHAILESLPSFIQLTLIGILTVFIFRILVRFKRWNDEIVHLKKFVRAVVTLIAVVLLENFCTWYATI